MRVLQTLQMSIPGGTSCTSPRPKDTRSRARTSNTPTVHSRRHSRTSPRPKDTRSRARTSNTPNVHSRRHRCTSLVPRTPVLVRVLQTLQLSILGGIRARPLVPRTPVLVRVLQTSPNVHSGGMLARPLVPRTPVLVRVLQTLQLSTPGGTLHVSSSQGHPFSCAYFKHSKCPFSAAYAHVVRPKDTRSRARTSNTPNFRTTRQTHTYTRPTAPRSRARISNLLNPECA